MIEVLLKPRRTLAAQEIPAEESAEKQEIPGRESAEDATAREQVCLSLWTTLLRNLCRGWATHR